jgi:hypothetical protein
MNLKITQQHTGDRAGEKCRENRCFSVVEKDQEMKKKKKRNGEQKKKKKKKKKRK